MYRRLLLVYTILACLGAPACKGPLVVDGEAPVKVPASAGENAGLEPRKNLLDVGDAVPEFTLADQKAHRVSAAELMAARGAVLVFLPAVDDPASRPVWDWVRRTKPLLDSRSLELLLVTPAPPDANASLAAREQVRLALLSDPGSWVAAAFGAAPALGAPPEAPHVFVLGSNRLVQLSARGLPPGADLVFAAESMPGIKKDNFFFAP